MKARVLQVLQSLVDLENETQLPTTVRELSKRAGYRSGSGVERHLNTLEQMGALSREPYTTRSIKSTRRGRSLLKQLVS